MTASAPEPLAATPWVLSIGVIASIALVMGAVHVIRKRGERRHGLLMLLAAVVLLVNVLILAWP